MKIRTILLFQLSIILLLSCGKENTPENPGNTTFSKGLLAYYPLNGDGNDKSGNNYHLTISGTTPTTDRLGNQHAAYKFGGVNDYMVIPKMQKANNLRQFTISLWVRPEMITYNTPISLRSPISNICSSTLTFFYNGSQYSLHDKVVYADVEVGCAADVYSASISNPIGTWHHLVLVQNYITVQGESSPRYIYDQYYDGVKLSSGTSGIGSNPDVVSFLNGGAIGGNNYNGELTKIIEKFRGDIDEVRIYNRALTSEEVAMLFSLKN